MLTKNCNATSASADAKTGSVRQKAVVERAKHATTIDV